MAIVMRVIAGLALLMAALPASAQITVFKCTDAHGQVSYQSTPCKNAQKQQSMQLSDDQPTVVAPAKPASTDSEITVQAPLPPQPYTPPNIMYQCVNAINGNTYHSSNGNPQPYLAPLGVTGMIPGSINDAYSAFALQHPVKPNGNMVGNNFTWVQDRCQPMPVDDTCRALRDEYDANELKLSRAFQSEQAPLLQREAELIAQLHHC